MRTEGAISRALKCGADGRGSEGTGGPRDLIHALLIRRSKPHRSRRPLAFSQPGSSLHKPLTLWTPFVYPDPPPPDFDLPMASHNLSSFTNLRDAFNSNAARQTAHTNGRSLGATTLATGPSSASAPPRPNPVNSVPNGPLSQHHPAALMNLLPPGSSVTGEALLAAIQSMPQSQQSSVPVGTQEDDQLLVRTLYESDDNGQTFRQALDNLNGVCNTCYMCPVLSQRLISHFQVHGHTAAQWRDYFLDHGRRITKLLNKYTPQPPLSAVPSMQAQPPRPRASVPSTPLSQPVTTESRRETQFQYSPVPQVTQPSGVPPRLSTQNTSPSRLGPSRIYNRGRPLSFQHRGRDSSYSPECPAKYPRPPQHHDDSDDEHRPHRKAPGSIVPPRPEHSPVPPKHGGIARNGKGYEFTDDDRKYLIDVILYEVGKEPALTKSEIFRHMEKVCPPHPSIPHILTPRMQAPHHSASSWSAYWKRQAGVMDTVYDAAKNLGTTKRSTRAALRRSKPAPRPPVPDRGDTRAESSSAESTSDDLSSWQSDPDTDADVVAMGGHGDLWHIADKRVLARWIATQPADWKQLPRKNRYTDFLQKVSLTSAGNGTI